MASTTEDDGAFEADFPDNKLTLHMAKKGGRVLRVTFHDTSSWCHEITWICTLIPDNYSLYFNSELPKQLSELKEKLATLGHLTSIHIDRWMFVFGDNTGDMFRGYTSLREIILKFLHDIDAHVTDITMKSQVKKVDAAAVKRDQGPETAPGGTTDHDVPCKDKHEVDEDVSHSHPLKKEASIDPSLKPLVKGDDSDRHASVDLGWNPSQSKEDPRLPTASHATPSQADLDLHDASRAGDLEEVKRLLSTPGVDVNSRDEWWSMTPVMEAAVRGHRDVVELLVKEGADVSLVDEVGNNILHFACQGGDVETVQYVLSLHVVDINSRGWWRSRTPVMEAAWWGHREVVELLVKEGADVSLVDEVGNNTLHFACQGGDVETVQYVLSLHVVDIDARNKSGETAADEARLWGHQPVVKLLKSRGAQ